MAHSLGSPNNVLLQANGPLTSIKLHGLPLSVHLMQNYGLQVAAQIIV